jgi:hypothetical protein
MSEREWTVALAKRDFEVGQLKSFGFVRAPMGSGWIVMLRGVGFRGPLVDARQGAVRVFKTMDAAISAVEGIGFQVKVIESV